MTSPNEPDELDASQKTLRGRVAGAIEQACVFTAKKSILLLLPAGGLFSIYLVGGYVAISLGVWSPSFEFLSVSDDVYFAWLGFISGTVICLGTGSLIALALLDEGAERTRNEISVLSSFVGFGFGAGLLRMTYMPVLCALV